VLREPRRVRREPWRAMILLLEEMSDLLIRPATLDDLGTIQGAALDDRAEPT
jgi:hypothetical protein